MNRSSVEVESDLAQRKPRCDVIVLASAHSPTGEPVDRVDVGVRIEREVALPRLSLARGVKLDLPLAVHGARAFERRGRAWSLGAPEPFVELPIRYEHAFGGELRVHREDEAARRLDDAHRLDDEARRRHPEGERAPVAHATCMVNPVGVGYLERWYADAAAIDRWPAPRIEAPGAGITADVFRRMLDGEARPGELPELTPRGLGVVARPWQPRLALAGTFDARWLAERWPLMPPDFRMAYWNCAHPDMQCEHLFGGEVVDLWNLLPPGAPGVSREARGTRCRFRLPDARVLVQLHAPSGARFHAPPIDTIVIDLAAMRLSLVWRAVKPASLGLTEAQIAAVGDEERRAAA
jgi:hypothetical protein